MHLAMSGTPTKQALNADADPVQIGSLLNLNNNIAFLNNGNVRMSASPVLSSAQIKSRRSKQPQQTSTGAGQVLMTEGQPVELSPSHLLGSNIPTIGGSRRQTDHQETVQDSYAHDMSLSSQAVNISESIDLSDDISAIKSKYKQVRRENQQLRTLLKQNDVIMQKNIE